MSSSQSTRLERTKSRTSVLDVKKCRLCSRALQCSAPGRKNRSVSSPDGAARLHPTRFRSFQSDAQSSSSSGDRRLPAWQAPLLRPVLAVVLVERDRAVAEDGPSRRVAQPQRFDGAGHASRRCRVVGRLLGQRDLRRRRRDPQLVVVLLHMFRGILNGVLAAPEEVLAFNSTSSRRHAAGPQIPGLLPAVRAARVLLPAQRFQRLPRLRDVLRFCWRSFTKGHDVVRRREPLGAFPTVDRPARRQ